MLFLNPLRSTVRPTRAGVLVRLVLAASAAAVAVALAAAPVQAHPAVRSDSVITWNANAGKAAVAACISPADDPLHESRLYAMTHVAIHDALNAIDRRSRPYALRTREPAEERLPTPPLLRQRETCWFRFSTRSPLPSHRRAALRAPPASKRTTPQLSRRFLTARPSPAGIDVGQAAAAAILALRAGDGSDTPLVVSDYEQGTNPGEYRFTPGTPFAFAPGWADVTPFVLRDSSQFRLRSALRESPEEGTRQISTR